MREQGGRRLNVSGVLRHLGVSRSGYNTWKNRIPSNQEQRKNKIKDKKFNPYSPDAIWCTDITYIWTYEGFVYLTSIMDLYSRKIISWVLSDTLETKWVVEAVNKAKRVRNADKPLIMHSDCGRQYTAKDYEEATAGMTLSYSKKAYPWDNACIDLL